MIGVEATIQKEILLKIKKIVSDLEAWDAQFEARLRRCEEALARRLARKLKTTADQRAFVEKISGLRVIRGGKEG
jgi:predicted phage gp36 major capsid-like protein